MTPQEQQLLMSLAQKVNQTRLEEKDPDAENLLGREFGANPDALYILAQTVLVQNIALDQARAQIAQLQQQLQQKSQPAHSTSFLGRLLGERDPEPQPAQPPQPPPYQPVPQYSQPQYSQPQYPPQGQWQQAPAPQYAPAPSGQPSFLRGAMQTAAGVAAGALAFEGVESVLHGLGGHGGGYGFGEPGFGGGGFDRPVEETVINNYYDEPGGGQRQGFEGSDRNDDDRGRDDRDDNLRGFDDSNTADSNDDNSDDGSGFDDGGQDDGGGFDDGGGGDGSDLV